MGQLSTHVLDTARGCPASGLRLRLFRLDGGRTLIAEAVTNSDGRCDGPILEGDAFIAGSYEFIFSAGAYFDQIGVPLPEPKFLDEVVIRFGVTAGDENFHVPLLLSPYGYSTYRGS